MCSSDLRRRSAGQGHCGSLADRATVLGLLQDLPAAVAAEAAEVLGFVERLGLHGRGIGWVDAHLLAAVALTDGASLWTRDKHLRAAAEALGCAWLAADREGSGAH